MREHFGRALIALGCAVVFLTEILSPLHLLRRAPLAIAWMALGAAAALALRRRGPGGLRHSAGLFEWLLIAAIAAIAAIVGFTALLSPPNSADAMAYHMPRVVYWAQAASVAFFPTPYFNQVMLPPLAEYFSLHAYVLSGGDRFTNLVQFLGFLGSVAAVSLIARELGADRRGQALAALFCATLPNGILQASGAKNDYLLACWLAWMAWFALRWKQAPGRGTAIGLGASLGLALLTKSTAYLFAPPLLAGCLWGSSRRAIRLAPVAVAGVLAINGPQYVRNLGLSGSPLGFDSAQGNGVYRWRNEHPGWRSTVSNLLRNTSEQLGGRSDAWNRAVYGAVVAAHRRLGIDPNDRDTTWPGAQFAPPRNSNHEADAHNRWHLLFLAGAGVWLLPARRWRAYYAGIAVGFVLFCFYLKWQPFLARLELPLFALASAVAGAVAGRVRPAALQAALCLLLLNNARPYLFENWTRPLKGPHSLLGTPRQEAYFNDLGQFYNRDAYLQAARQTLAAGCERVGIDISENQVEYPYQALLLEANPRIRFFHTGVTNVSAKYQRDGPQPCAVLCPDCEQNQEKIRLYRVVGEPRQIGRFLLFLPPRG